MLVVSRFFGVFACCRCHVGEVDFGGGEAKMSEAYTDTGGSCGAWMSKAGRRAESAVPLFSKYILVLALTAAEPGAGPEVVEERSKGLLRRWSL